MNFGGREVVGLVPAGGKGERIAPLPCSKELFPIGFQIVKERSQRRPKVKVVCQYLLENFQRAGITQAYIILRKGKWDIPAFFGDGELVNIHLAYLIMRKPFGPPFTLDQAYPFIQNKMVAFGFPDIMINTENVYKSLLDYQKTTRADVVLAIYPAHNPHEMDMVEIDDNGKIHNMYLKPKETNLRLCWLCGVWTPLFTEFMHRYLANYQKPDVELDCVTKPEVEDLPVGAVLQAAIHDGLQVTGVVFSEGTYLDIGTPENLKKSVAVYGCQSS